MGLKVTLTAEERAQNYRNHLRLAKYALIDAYTEAVALGNLAEARRLDLLVAQVDGMRRAPV